MVTALISGDSVCVCVRCVCVCAECGSGCESYLDVLDAFSDLVGAEVSVGHQRLPLAHGGGQVGGAAHRLVLQGAVPAQQAHRARQVLPAVLRRQHLLLLPDPALLHTAAHCFTH